MFLTLYPFETFLLILWLAVITDLLIGDPVYPFHPVRLIGNLITFIESQIQKNGIWNYLGGGLLTALVISIVVAVYSVLYYLIQFIPYGLIVFDFYLFYSFVSVTDLNRHGMRIYDSLKSGNLPLARENLSWIVGRDTKSLTETEVVQATVESLSESTSDGIIGPLLFGFIFGPLGMLLYKTVNTLDSMVGYKNKRYGKVGFVSAKLDDLVNLLPARITFLLYILCKPKISIVFTAFKNRNNHTSPNAGYPEAAIASLLNIRLGGPSQYKGRIVEKPFINAEGDRAVRKHIVFTIRYVLVVTIFFMVLSSLLVFFVKEF